MKKNLFLAFEGIDGCGKSTQAKLLADFLERAGHKVYLTCEPTESPIGTMIRNIFSRKMEADDRVIAGLFVADRLDHILNKTNGLLKKLEEGYTVITDRYYFSSYAYQGTHIPMNWVIQANSLSAELLRPDLNIYIDISPERSMQRIQAGRTQADLYETLENLQSVRNNYLKAFEQLRHQENIFVTNGDQPIEALAATIWENVSELLNPM